MSLKVIGAGGPRTGTASLRAALEKLGYVKTYHMEGLLNTPDQAKYWKELYDTGKTDFDTLFDGYAATVDFPGFLAYKDLLRRYPDAKVILGVRDPESWYESALKTVYAVTPQTLGQKLSLMKKMIFSVRFRKIAKVFMLPEKYLWGKMFKGQFKNREMAIRIYNEFNEEVKRHVPPGQLLVYNLGDGWEPLCRFLNVPVPNEPYPHKNKREKFHEQVARMMSTGEELELK